ncbi:MAG TPA: sulfotransferase [Gaiellales bacterium]|nr:sulfotransferase [Gaiellales bacterium]
MLRIVGAGLPRTGTNSLKLALERLTGGRCYHMLEVSETPGAADVWKAAAEGQAPDWDVLLGGYVAAVDWPASAFWRELAAANPEAPVLLSQRTRTEQWWASVEKTVARALTTPSADPEIARIRVMGRTIARRFCPEWPDPVAVQAAYERHNAEVRASIAPDRLVEWRPADGWEPLCTMLGVPVPDEPFPRTNDVTEFRAVAKLDDAG